MDLLLHLIAKHKLNIRDIEISILLEQYLLYMQQCAEQDYELAGEFLTMAAKLIWMKTAALLPRPEEAEAVKKELEGALIEYSLCKIAAGNLREGSPDGKRFAVIAQNGIRVSGLFRYTREYVFRLGCSGRRQYGVFLLIPEHADAFVRIVPAAGHPDFLAVIHKNISAHHTKQTGCHFDFFNV